MLNSNFHTRLYRSSLTDPRTSCPFICIPITLKFNDFVVVVRASSGQRHIDVELWLFYLSFGWRRVDEVPWNHHTHLWNAFEFTNFSVTFSNLSCYRGYKCPGYSNHRYLRSPIVFARRANYQFAELTIQVMCLASSSVSPNIEHKCRTRSDRWWAMVQAATSSWHAATLNKS